MKMIVATIDRLDPRAIPQTAWPLVQPLPSWVPTPTRSPPAMRNIGLVPMENPIASSKARSAINAPSGSPIKKARRQPRSKGLAKKLRPRMPLIPATFPFTSSRPALARPMSAPPINAGIGVNEVSTVSVPCDFSRVQVTVEFLANLLIPRDPQDTSISTCPPGNPAWWVLSHMPAPSE